MPGQISHRTINRRLRNDLLTFGNGTGSPRIPCIAGGMKRPHPSPTLSPRRSGLGSLPSHSRATRSGKKLTGCGISVLQVQVVAHLVCRERPRSRFEHPNAVFPINPSPGVADLTRVDLVLTSVLPMGALPQWNACSVLDV